MKRKVWASAIALILCACVAAGSLLPAGAASSVNLAQFFASLGSGSGNINVSQFFAQWLEGQINNQEESVIDKFVNNLKNQFNGTTSTEPGTDEETESITLKEGEADNIAKLFNLTVNELKKGQPGFTKIQTATMDAKIASSLQGGLGPVTGIVESLIGTKDIFAGAIDGTNQDTQTRVKYQAGNDVINNIPVSGKEYVACLTEEDIKDYSITIYKTGAYTMHVDLIDVEGNAAASGLSHVFDTTDKEYATIELGTTSLNISVKLKYVNNYVECQVNRNGEIISYTMGMGITFMFKQGDGSYSSIMPYTGVDFEKEGIIYNLTTEFTSIDFANRKMGDADNDGKVNSTDARLVLRMSAGLEECSEETKPYCDINGDGRILPDDARAILRAASGMSTLPTTEEALGVKEYQRDEATTKHVEDLLVLIMAYQAAKDEEEQQELQDYYNQKYNGSGTVVTEPEETTSKIYTTGDKVNDVIGGIGTIIGGLLGN